MINNMIVLDYSGMVSEKRMKQNVDSDILPMHTSYGLAVDCE